jgi:hypothetical protein
MVRSAEAAAREAKLAELKQLITSRHYESLEKLEDAVDALLWGDSEVAQLTAGPDRDDRESRVAPPKRPR